MMSIHSKQASDQLFWTLILVYSVYLLIDKIDGKETTSSCDFEKYPIVGCRHSETQICDQKSELCKCSSKYPISLLNEVCLQYKSINESCMASVQCTHISNAGCFGSDIEFKDDFWVSLWVRLGLRNPGKCLCDTFNGFQFNNITKECVKKVVIGSKCQTDSQCLLKVPNSHCGQSSEKCQCNEGYYNDPDSDGCKLNLLVDIPIGSTYDHLCNSDEGCADPEMICLKGLCKCRNGFHFDKYKSKKCELRIGSKCLDTGGLTDCLDQSFEAIKTDRNLNKLSEFDLIEPPRIYSIFVILALWICLLFILGNAKRGLKLVEQAVRRDQSSQYRQCDTCSVQSIIETDGQEMGTSQMSLQSDISAAINQNYGPVFDELYPNECQPYSDEPPTYEEVVRFDKQKTFVV